MQRNWKSLKNGAIWDPKKDDEGNALQPTSKSVLIGYYEKTEHDQGPKQNSQLHSIEAIEMNGKEVDPQSVSVWGSHILDDQLSKVKPGQLIRIQWLGLTQPQKKGGQPYHDWEVSISNEFKNVSGPAVQAKTEPAQVPGPRPTTTAGSQTPAAAVNEEAEDDDLPF